jgi:hypothetical protein
MIDAINVSPTIHIIAGTLVLLASIVALLATGRAAWKRERLGRAARLLFVLFQVTLMGQILVGIKLLDQGLGPLQLYIHYLGGLAPMAFSLIYYWLPATDEATRARRVATVSGLSFVFVLMTFAIGSMYLPGGA